MTIKYVLQIAAAMIMVVALSHNAGAVIALDSSYSMVKLKAEPYQGMLHEPIWLDNDRLVV